MARNQFDLNKFASAAQDSTLAEAALQQKAQSQKELVPLADIGGRPGGDTRSLNQKHIKQLAESISVIGLITPLTLDRNSRLLAGGHRKAALDYLAQAEPDIFEQLFADGVPVHIMDVDAEKDVVDALQIEVEENTQRRNYTQAEIYEAAQKLEAAGYKPLRGRPRQGEKSLNRELMTVFRLSRRHVSRLLNPPSNIVQKSEPCGSLFKQTATFLKQAEKFQKKLVKEEVEKDAVDKVQQDLKRLIKNLNGLLQKINSGADPMDES